MLASLAMLNETFSVIFKHRVVVVGYLVVMHKSPTQDLKTFRECINASDVLRSQERELLVSS